MTARVVIDACVLFPPVVRALVLAVAETGAFEPVWSRRILDEWRIAVSRAHGHAVEAEVRAAEADMAARFPTALLAGDLPDPVTGLPDPGDEHVVAAALAGEASEILTFNLRDFPARVLAPMGLSARHPDGFLWEMASHGSDVSAAIRETLAAHAIAPERARSALKRARLSRLGKAMFGLG